MCSLEFPDLEADFHQEYADRGLIVLGLSSGGRASNDDLRTFVASMGVTFPILTDTDGTYTEYTVEQAFTPYPIDVVLDAGGTIVYLSRTYDPEQLRAAVESVLE